MLTGGETSDYLAVPEFLDMLVAKSQAMLADKGYDGDDVRASLLMKGILPVIPPKSNRKQPIECDFKRYKDRNRIERMFNRLKQFRRIATRYDKTAKSYLAFLSLAAASCQWLLQPSSDANSKTEIGWTFTSRARKIRGAAKFSLVDNANIRRELARNLITQTQTQIDV